MNETDIGIKFTNKINGLTGKHGLEKYAETLNIIKSSLAGFDKGIASQVEQSAKNMTDISKDTKDMAKKVNIAFNYTTIRQFTRAIKNLFTTMSSYVAKSSDYLENINLYQVAFEGDTKAADKFINKLTEMYGLDESWLTRTVGIFKQLSNAMSLSTEQGTKLATLLTQMSIDISSLYNIDVDNASSILQSALAGQTKPIRGATGADITTSTLQSTLNQLGIDKAVNSLSYAEKRLVIIISLTQQLTEATNDFGKTIESPANQTRILREQWERFTRSIGNVFLPIMAKILPYLNAILMVLTEIINTVARLFGFKIEDYDYGVSGIADSVLELEENMNGAADSANKLKSGLRGFDKLNVITTPSTAGANVGGTGVSADIMGAFDKAYDEYNQKLKNIQMKATSIRDAIMEWLGFTKEVDEETGEVSFKFEHFTLGTALGALAVGGSVYLGIKTIGSIIKKITGLELFKIDGKFLKNLGGILLIVEGVKLTIEGINSLLDPMQSKFKGIIKIIEGIALGITGVAILIGAWPVALGAAIVAGIALLTEFIVKNWDLIKNYFKEVGETYKEFFRIVGAKLGEVWDKFKEKISQVYDKVVWLKNQIVNVFKYIGNAIADFISGAIKSVINGIFYRIESSINGFIKLLNAAISTINKIPGVNITRVSTVSLPRLKKGLDFVPNDYYPAYLDYGERVLTKEENERYTATMENSNSKFGTSVVKPIIIVQVGNRKLAEVVLDDLSDIAKTNGKPIKIGG